MNLSDHEIETLLRQAPAPVPPMTLPDQLLSSFKSPTGPDPIPPEPRLDVRGTGGGWKRWLPLLVPAAVTAAFSAALVVQRIERQDLERELQQWKAQANAAEFAPSLSARAPAPLPDERQEILRLRELAERLASEVAAIEQIVTQNQQLRARIAANRAQLSPELQGADELASHAQAIQCVNNLKQMGLAVRIWAQDNDGQSPPNLVSMSNELTTPKILVCPADTSREPATDWTSFNMSHVSYEFLSPGPGVFETEPNRLLFRCPIHGNIGLCDGSVQMSVAKNHPEQIIWRNGAQYMEGTSAGPAANVQPGTPPAGAGMSDEMRRRYGLAPAGNGASAGGEASGAQPRYQMSPELMKRYGLLPQPAESEPESVESFEVQPDAEPQPEPQP